jgi:hypothetical protein
MSRVKAVFLIRLFLALLLFPACAMAEKFELKSPGTEDIVNYSKYGKFLKVGEDGYHYDIEDLKGLIAASGEGIYPDEETVYSDPAQLRLMREKKLEGSIWEYLDGDDSARNFYKWAISTEDPAVKQFFIGVIFEKAGMYREAIKAYYATLIHFPRGFCWAEDQSFVWFVADAALSSVINICRAHPELDLQIEGAYIDIRNGNDTDPGNDIIITDPGKLVKGKKVTERKTGKVVSKRGSGRVYAAQYENGDWGLFVDGKPFFVKAVHYGPTKIGESPVNKEFDHNAWMWNDENKNGKIDAAYDSWVDANKNNVQDPDEKAVGDFQLLKDMGANAIKLYASGSKEGYKSGALNKEVLRDLYKTYGIMVIMGDFLGAYTVGSGADWNTGTDYNDPEHRKKMMESVKRMVMEHKDEPYVLMWQLGNENEMGCDYTGVNATRTNAGKYPEAYLSFVEEVAKMIHEIDPDHPVSTGNLTTSFLHLYKKLVPSVDIYGVNIYFQNGFGAVWSKIKRNYDRPLLITEFGCDSYYNNVGERQDLQKEVFKNCWEDICYNRAGGKGIGNSIGGIMFEWLDEWWKDTHSGDSPSSHQTKSQFRMNFFDGWSQEEWLGLCGQGDGSKSPFLRQPKEAYYYFAEEGLKGKK